MSKLKDQNFFCNLYTLLTAYYYKIIFGRNGGGNSNAKILIF